MPKFSVIVPTYRSIDVVAESIGSVLAQTFPDFELIVVDDASSDGTAEYVERTFGEKVRLLRVPVNAGPGAARNLGAAEARGEFLAFLDADDLYFPWTLATLHEVLSASPEIDFVLAGHVSFSSGKPLVAQMSLAVLKVSSPLELLAEQIRPFATLFTVRREVFVQAGGFETRRMNWEDWDFFLRLRTRGAALVRSPHLVAKRIREGTLTANRELYLKGAGCVIERQLAGKYAGAISARFIEATLLFDLRSRLDEGIPRGELREILSLLTKLLIGEGRPLRLVCQVLVTTYGWASAKARPKIHRGIHRLRGISDIDRFMHHLYRVRHHYRCRLGRLAQRLPLPKAITLRWLEKLYVVDELEKAGGGFPTLFSADLPLSEAHSPIGQRLLRYGIWGPALTANFAHRLREGDVVLDAGANFGAHTLLASRLVGPKGLVYAFEPSKRIRARLEANLSRNRISNVIVMSFALGNRMEELSLYDGPADNDGQNSLVKGRSTNGEPVEVRRLDSFEVPWQRVRLIKIDVEGFELEVLEGMSGIVAKLGEEAEVLVELSDLQEEPRRRRFQTFARSFGFRIYEIANRYEDREYLPWAPLEAPRLVTADERFSRQVDCLLSRRPVERVNAGWNFRDVRSLARALARFPP